MGQLYANIAIGFQIYLDFFPIFIVNLITISTIGATFGIVIGFFYFATIKR